MTMPALCDGTLGNTLGIDPTPIIPKGTPRKNDSVTKMMMVKDTNM